MFWEPAAEARSRRIHQMTNTPDEWKPGLRKSGKPTGGVSSPSVPPPPPPAPSSSVVEEGGIGDLLLDNKPTFKEGHTNYITLRAEDITEVVSYAQRFSAEDTTGASCRAEAREARGRMIWSLPLEVVSTNASWNNLLFLSRIFIMGIWILRDSRGPRLATAHA